jgi:hypothetical protein
MLNGGRRLFFTALSLAAGISFADTQTTSTNALPQTLSLPGQPVYQLQTIECPHSSDLVKDPQTNRWSALGVWNGSDESLVTSVTTFLGAQWQGINLGQPFCIYQGVPQGTFDIILAYHTFAVTPQAGKWQANANQTVFKCFSHDSNDCLFQVRLKPKELSVDQQLDQIKPGQSNDTAGNQGF